MIVAVYGISRAGKDYLIDDLVSLHPLEIAHIKGSFELINLSQQRYNKNFAELTQEEQKNIRIDFINFLKENEKKYKNIIVDGHFAFPSNDGFQIVYNEADYNIYDAVFYLNRSVETIKTQVIKVNKNDEIGKYLLIKDNAKKWADYEIFEMTNIYNSSNKDFFILDEDFVKNIEFIYQYLQGDFNSKKIVNNIINKISNKIKGINTILLTDLDKTLSINDATYDFLIKADLSEKKVKEIFINEYYTGYQFYCFHEYILNATNYIEAIEYANNKCILNQKLIKNINNQRPANTLIIGITTGLADLWYKKNYENNLLDIIIGKFNCNREAVINELITKKIKGLLAKQLKEKGINIISMGDSSNDLSMIGNSNKGFLICGSSINKVVQENVHKLANKNIFQPSFNIEKYENITIKDEIW